MCMDDDLEKALELISCGNEGCTFKICSACAKTYYGNPYKYTKCPQCRQTSTGDKIEDLKPANPPTRPAPTRPAPLPSWRQFGFENDMEAFIVLMVYLTIFLLLAWLIGTMICLAFGLEKSTRNNYIPGGTFGYVIPDYYRNSYVGML